MIHVTARSLAGVAAAGLLLAGCSSAPDSSGTTAAPSSSTSASTEPSASASPSPTLALTAAEQQAFEEATKVVLAYRQTITDLFSGARTNLNDLNEVAAGDSVLDDGLVELQQRLAEGWRSEPKGAQLALVSAEPESVGIGASPDRVIITACIDSTSVTGVSPEGRRTPGMRERAEYTVTRTSYLPAPGWAVTRTTVAKAAEDRQC